MKRTSLVLVILMTSAIILPFSNVGIASSEVVCCESIQYDMIFSGSSTNGLLSPFESSLGTEQNSEVGSAITQATEVGRWSGQTNFGGSYPSHTATFILPYRINDGAGVTINATVELRLGSESNTGSTALPQTFLPGEEGVLELDIDVSEGTLLAEDSIIVIFSVQELLLPTGQNPSIKFLWGTTQYRGAISIEAPLFDIDIEEPIIEGRSAHIPVKFNSGYGAQLIAESNFEFYANGNLIEQSPVSTQGNLLTWTWATDISVDDGKFPFSIKINFQNGTTVNAEIEYDIEFGESEGNSYFYPLTEPIRTGGTDLDVNVEVDLSTDIEKTITLQLQENVAFWIRWGLDNMGNPNLNSTSWLRNLDPANSEYYQNRIIDNAEVSSFETQIRQTELNNFLSQGLGIDSRRLLGLERADFDYVGVELVLNGDDTVSNTPVTLTFKTRQTNTGGQEHLMLDNFIKPYFEESDRIWSSINYNFLLKTDAINGVFVMDFTDVEVTQTRLIFTQKITASTTFTQSDSPQLWVQQGGTPIDSPLAIFVICSGIVIAGLIISLLLSREKNKIILISEIIIFNAVGFLIYFLSLEFIIVLISAVSSSGLWILTAMMSNTKDDEPHSRISADSSNSGYPSFDCPNCSASISITSNERPLRITCSGCNKVLKIVD
ncbi:MAG: hypothetical protein VYE59_03945 [Candidatus Thermoplasmatota archaeon]|nr:hypothetical protein [Candidatus Thermoplasmatota archaeon]